MQPLHPNLRLRRVDELDGIRGILALWVAVSHILCWCGFAVDPPHGFGVNMWYQFIFATPAVDIFIILSGFAISFLLDSRQPSYSSFMTGRFFRIYPVYFVCLLLGIATSFLTPFILTAAGWHRTYYFDLMRGVLASERAHLGAHIFWHMALLNGILPKQLLLNSASTLLPPAWSLSLEWQFYLVAPLLLRSIRSATGLMGVALIVWLALRWYEPWNNPSPAFLLPQLPLFLIGIISYHIYSRFAASDYKSSSTPGIPVAALIATALIVKWHPVALAAWAVGFGCIFVQGSDLFSKMLCAIRKLLLCRGLQHLGKVSYPLYVVHWPIILLLLAALLRCRPEISSRDAALFLLACGLPLILIAAGLLHRWIEMPFMALGKRLDRRSPRTESRVILPPTDIAAPAE